MKKNEIIWFGTMLLLAGVIQVIAYPYQPLVRINKLEERIKHIEEILEK